jgi:hypothetical protein
MACLCVMVKFQNEKVPGRSPGLCSCSFRGGLEAIVDTTANDIRMEAHVG